MNTGFNLPADKASNGKTATGKQLITESNWNLLLRYGHVDPARSASDQGYEVVDEVKYHFGGPTKRRRRSSAGDLIGGQENVSDDTKRLRATVSKEQVSNDLIPKMEAGPSSTNSGSSGKPSGWRSQWTEEEIQELVRLRCQGMSYPSIAKDPKYLPGRDLNAIQQKFAKLKKVSPYKEQWSRFKDGKEKQEMQAIGHGNTEGDGDENEDDDY